MTSAPRTPGMAQISSRGPSSFSGSCTKFPKRVAAASAKAQLFATTMAASAFPREREWPTVPEEVQTPQPSPGSTATASSPLRGLSPATTATLRRFLPNRNTSPPFSTMTSPLFSARLRPTYSAMAPATAAMGPTPAREPASNIRRMRGLSVPWARRGSREVRKRGLSAIWAST